MPDRSGAEVVEVAIVHRPRYDDWSLPKGKLISGESEFEAALREVREETGYRARPGRSLGTVRYLKSSGGLSRPKVVRYWAMEASSGVFAPHEEVDGLRWIPLDEARKVLTHPTDREVMGRFSSQPPSTGLILLVRHASAGQRSKWKGDDRLRPLDGKGAMQAQALARFLIQFDVQGILSADFARCAQTVEPLGEITGVAVKDEPLLSEVGYPGHENEAMDLLCRLEEDGGAFVACSQGDVIPDLLGRLASRDRVPLNDDFVAPKGSVWVLCFSGSKLCAVEYFPPPEISH